MTLNKLHTEKLLRFEKEYTDFQKKFGKKENEFNNMVNEIISELEKNRKELSDYERVYNKKSVYDKHGKISKTRSDIIDLEMKINGKYCFK
jgi:oligoendopeptidase F